MKTERINLQFRPSIRAADTQSRSKRRVDEKSDKKWYKKERVQLKKWCPLRKFPYVFFSVTQSFLLGFSWSSDIITASNKINTSKGLSVYLR